ncbi:SMC family ATPase [bacterium]|nr:SMC family ATPase [bacterium]
MIIKSLYCKNFMKFKELRIREIPEKGLIGIIGENEAGKSTIGEAISYGLFGQCTREDSGVENIMFWGAKDGFVEVKVSFGTELFLITRTFSKEDESISIRNVNQNIDLSEDEMKGFYQNKLKLSFKEFRYSSYVAQKELSIIQSHKEDRLEVISSMLGLNKLDVAKDALKEEFDISKKDSKSIDSKIEKLKDDLSEVQLELAEKQEVVDEIDKLVLEKESIDVNIKEKEDKLNQLLEFEDSSQQCRILKEKELLLKDNLEALVGKMENFSQYELESKNLSEELETSEKELEKLNNEKNSLEETEARLHEQGVQAIEYTKLQAELKSFEKAESVKKASIASLEETQDIISEELKDLKEEKDEIIKGTQECEKATGNLSEMKSSLIEKTENKKNLEKELEGFEEVREKLEEAGSIKVFSETIDEEIEVLNSKYYKEENVCNGNLEKVKQLLVELGQKIIKFNDQDIIDSKKVLLKNHFGKENLFGGLFALSLVAILGWVFYTKVYIYASFGIFPLLFLIVAIVSRKKGIVLEKELESDIFLNKEKKGVIDAEYKSNSEEKSNYEIQLQEIKKKSEMIKSINLNDRYSIEDSLEKLRDFSDNNFEFSLLKIQTFLKENEIDGTLTEYYESISSELKALNDKKDELENLKTEIEKSGSDIRLIEEKRSLLEKYSESLKKVENRIKRKEKESEKHKDQNSFLAGELKIIETQIADLKKNMNAQTIVEVTDKDKEKLSSDEKALDKNIIELKERIVRLKEKQNLVSVKKQDHSKLEEEKMILEGKIKDIYQEYDNLEKGLEKIGFSVETLAVLREDVNGFNLKVRDILEKIALKNGFLDKFGDAERMKKNLLEQLSETEELERNMRDNILYFPEVIKMYDLTRDNVIKKIKPQIERYFATYLPKLTNNRYKKVLLQEDFSIQIFSDEKNDYVPIKNLSGGTEDQILLMFRLAFSKALFPGMHDTDDGISFHQFLFLDEPISSFDQKRQNAFIELLRMMEKLYQQIFVISHITELENKMDYFIKAEATSNVLEVDRI